MEQTVSNNDFEKNVPKIGGEKICSQPIFRLKVGSKNRNLLDNPSLNNKKHRTRQERENNYLLII